MEPFLHVLNQQGGQSHKFTSVLVGGVRTQSLEPKRTTPVCSGWNPLCHFLLKKFKNLSVGIDFFQQTVWEYLNIPVSFHSCTHEDEITISYLLCGAVNQISTLPPNQIPVLPFVEANHEGVEKVKWNGSSRRGREGGQFEQRCWRGTGLEGTEWRP